jgi:hypothetical protein
MHNLGVLASYTLETSFGGANGSHYTADDLRQMGVYLCAALLDFSACLNITRNAALPTPSPRIQPADGSSARASEVCGAAANEAFPVAAESLEVLTVVEPAVKQHATSPAVQTQSDDSAVIAAIPAPAATVAPCDDDTSVVADKHCAQQQRLQQPIAVASTATVNDSVRELPEPEHGQLLDAMVAVCSSIDDAASSNTKTDEACELSVQLSQLAVEPELSVTFTAGELQHMLQEEVESVSTVATAAAADVADRSRANSTSRDASVTAVQHNAALIADAATDSVNATTAGADDSIAGAESTLDIQPASALDDDADSSSSVAADVAEADSSSVGSDVDDATEIAEVQDDVCDTSDAECLIADGAVAQQRAGSDCAFDEQLGQTQVTPITTSTTCLSLRVFLIKLDAHDGCMRPSAQQYAISIVTLALTNEHDGGH